jgi:DNA-binding transcriptional LysR family regulator
MEVTLAGLRALRETAERGTFTAAAAALGFSQSALSRQIAALERATGTRLFDRTPDGPRLTREGRLLLRHGAAALDEVDLVTRLLRGGGSGGRVRLGMILSAGPVLLPRTVDAVRRSRPDLVVTTRIGSTPSLIRGLRAGTLDLAVLTSRPPHRPVDNESPPLRLRPLLEMALRVAVATDGPLGEHDALTLDDLAGQPWIVSPSRSDETLLGAWPSLPGRPRVRHTSPDWATKLHLVAAGCGITTVPPILLPAAPPGVRALPVVEGPREMRRMVAAWLPGRTSEPPREVLDILAGVAGEFADEGE